MNIDIVDPANPMLFASFNQDYSRLVIGTRLGFKLFNTEPDFVPVYKDENGGCSLVEVLYSTKLVAVVGSGEHPSSPARRVSLINCGHGKEIYSLTFPTPVLAVRMSKNRLIVVTESVIYLYELQTNRLLTTIDTPPNPHGVVALTNRDPENGQTQSLLAFPGHTTQGDLVLYDTNALKIARVVKSIHKTPLRFIQFSPDDRVIATASETGTVIKVRAVDPRLDKELTFRRGTLHGATIASIAFNSDGSLLAVSSSNGTVHLFKVPSLYDLELNQKYVSDHSAVLTSLYINHFNAVVRSPPCSVTLAVISMPMLHAALRPLELARFHSAASLATPPVCMSSLLMASSPNTKLS
jgi:autophagy-related protein 18